MPAGSTIDVARLDGDHIAKYRFGPGGPGGVEPNLNSGATAAGDCGCVNCPGCCAANALQGGRSDCPALASLDADLQRVVGAWNGLPVHIRKTILALVGFVEPPAIH